MVKYFSDKLAGKRCNLVRGYNKKISRSQRSYSKMMCKQMEKINDIESMDEHTQIFDKPAFIEKYTHITNWLFNFLRKHSGMEWNKVYSILSERFDKRSKKAYLMWREVNAFLRDDLCLLTNRFSIEDGILKFNEPAQVDKIPTLEESLNEEQRAYKFIGAVVYKFIALEPLFKPFLIIPRKHKLFWGAETNRGNYRQTRELTKEEYDTYNSFSDYVRTLITYVIE